MSDSKLTVVVCIEGGSDRRFYFLAKTQADVRTHLATDSMCADLTARKEITVAEAEEGGYVSSESITRATQRLADDEYLAQELLNF